MYISKSVFLHSYIIFIHNFIIYNNNKLIIYYSNETEICN